MSALLLSSRARFMVSFSVVALLFSTPAGAGVGIWTTNGPAGGQFGVIADFRTPGVVYTGGESGLFKTTDNGSTWASIPVPLGAGGYAPLATGAQATVYATGPYTGGNLAAIALLASPDQGGHWNVLASGEFGTSYWLVVDPVTPTTLYLATNYFHGPAASQSLERSTDGGLTGTGAGAGLAAVTKLVVAPSAPSTLYAATVPFPSAPFPFSSRAGVVTGLSRSLDSGTTWSLRTDSLQDVNSLAVDPTNSSTVYAATSSSGVMKSTDGGSTFSPANNGLPDLYVASLCIDPLRSNRLYAATGNGVFGSVDAAATWQPLNNGFTPSDLANITGLAIDATGAYLHASTYGLGIFDYQITDLPCPPDSHTLCLNNGRFALTADFHQTSEGPSSRATAVPLTSDTGVFWFFDPANIELVVKVLTGCSVNNEYWVFAGGLTNVGVEMKVTDTQTGAFKMYSNAVGTPFQPIQDSSAFPCP